MQQQLVIVQALGGKPLKRVLMTTSEKGVHVADPGLLEEIKTGIHAPVAVLPEQVFNFDELIFDELLVQWRSLKQTNAETWAKLGNFQSMYDSVD